MIWAFDVDGTLIGSIRSDVLRPGAAELLAALADRGATCVLWSAGGADYARRMAERHGIDGHIAAYYAKDERDEDGKYTHDHFHEDHRITTFVDDSPIDIPHDRHVVRVPQFIGGNPADRVLHDLLSHLDRHVVMGRLAELYGEFAGEQALQFEGRWFTWGRMGDVRVALGETLAARRVPATAAVAIVMRQRPALVAAELAALAQGRTAVLVTPLQGDRALAEDIAALAPAVIVAHPTDWARPGVQDAVEACGALGLELGDDLQVAVRVDVDRVVDGPSFDAAVTVLSSGTTGPPKRLPVTWDTFVHLGGGPRGRRPVSGRGAILLSLPLVTLGGLLSMTRLVFGGRPMSMMERFDVHAWAALVKEHRPTVMGAPPPVVKMILDAEISPDHFEGVTAYITSSAPVAPEIATAFEERYGIPVLLGYGATEFLSAVTGWTAELWAKFGATKLGSVGRAYPRVRLRVIDPATGDELPAGEAGILEVDPPQRAGGLPMGWMRTSDRARIDADGFLWILGRADDVIVRGGFKVDLHQVEAVLREHPAVTAATAVGLSDERLGHVPAAVVTVDAEVGESALIEWCRERLAPYAVPVQVLVVEAIPQTSTFKPHRVEIERLLRG